MKKIFIFLLALVLIIGGFYFINQSDGSIKNNENGNSISLYFFYGRTCPHCAAEKEFLEELEGKYSELNIQKLVAENENISFLRTFYEKYKVPEELHGWVPVTFIEEKYFLGFDQKIGQEIEDYIIELIKEIPPEPNPEPVEPSDPNAPSDNGAEPNPGSEPENNKKVITIPFLGDIEYSNFSPLVLSIILGTIDGFNACAMVALSFLLAVLIATKTRKRVFLIGGTFILVSGIIYFIFITAWLNLFICLESVNFINVLVGIVIIIFSIFLLKDYFQGVICRVCEISEKKENILGRFEKKLFSKMKEFADVEMSLPLALLGVITVAIGVNMVELCCSIGFPLTFTKILTSWQLPTLSYYFYLIIYIICYMLDDFLIFVFAVSTLKITQASEKYLKFIKLFSGIILLILGLLMIIKPELLFF